MIHVYVVVPRPICGRTYSELAYRVLYGEGPYSVPVRRALYGEDHTAAGLLGDNLWGWGA